MMESQKTKFFIFWTITILLFFLYLLDRSQVKKRGLETYHILNNTKKSVGWTTKKGGTVRLLMKI